MGSYIQRMQIVDAVDQIAPEKLVKGMVMLLLTNLDRIIVVFIQQI